MRKEASRKLSLLFFFILYLLLSFSQLGLGKWSSKGLEKQEEAEGKWEVVEEDGSFIGSREEARTLLLEEAKKGSWKKNSSSWSSEIWKATNSSPTWQMNCQKKNPTTNKCQCRKRRHSEFSVALRLSKTLMLSMTIMLTFVPCWPFESWCSEFSQRQKKRPFVEFSRFCSTSNDNQEVKNNTNTY